MKYRYILVGIGIILFFVPFFWMQPGQVDLGGDASRAYFYDPVSYLRNFSFYFIVPQGIGLVEPNFFSLPFLLVLSVIRYVTGSPYLTITIFNAIKLLLSFFSIYSLIKELLKVANIKDKNTNYAALLGALFYILTPTMTGNWDRALLSHNQVFINPLVFLLLLKFIVTKENIFLWLLLLVSFIFSNSFSYTSAPPFFAFFPLSITFLFLYLIIYKVSIPYKKLLLGFFAFLGLQAFHLIPQIINLTDIGSYTNGRIFNKDIIINEGVRYFQAILPLAKVSNYILLSYGTKEQLLTTCIPFGTILIGFILNKKVRKPMILISLFYLITLFLISANITHIWPKIYEKLFYLPGFSMFRNFIGQWLFVFSFFNTLLFSFSVYCIFSRLSIKYKVILSLGLTSILILTSWNFVSGKDVNRVVFVNSNAKITHRMDPAFIETLDYIKKMPTDSKFLVLPLTDAYYQVVPGEDGGVYIGPSLISYLAGKKDFVGYQVLSPFGNDFLTLVKEKKFEGVKKLLAILNIQYILHNSSTFVLDDNNEPFLYNHVGNFLPNSQHNYVEFIRQIAPRKVYQNGNYNIYKLEEALTLPHIYLPQQVVTYDQTASMAAILQKATVTPFVLIPENDCKILSSSCKGYTKRPKISFQMINPTKYKISVTNATSPYMLVFSEAYHNSWELYLDTSSKNISKVIRNYPSANTSELAHKQDLIGNIFEIFGKKQLNDITHVQVNGYANAWEVVPASTQNKKEYTLILELGMQHNFYLSLIISIICFILLLLWGWWLFHKKKYKLQHKK